jgi:outer membrane protein assembly factor BamB
LIRDDVGCIVIAPVISLGDGTGFVGSNDSNLYAVDAATDTKQWVFQT